MSEENDNAKCRQALQEWRATLAQLRKMEVRLRELRAKEKILARRAGGILSPVPGKRVTMKQLSEVGAMHQDGKKIKDIAAGLGLTKSQATRRLRQWLEGQDRHVCV